MPNKVSASCCVIPSSVQTVVSFFNNRIFLCQFLNRQKFCHNFCVKIVGALKNDTKVVAILFVKQILLQD